MTTTPHKHAEVIKAWADGAEIETESTNGKWLTFPKDCNPEWLEHVQYRVKPAKPERAPIKLKSDEQEMMKFYYAHEGDMMESAICLVKQVVQWELDAGSIVAREEFDRAVGDRASRDLQIARAVNFAMMHGGFMLSQEQLHKIIAGVKP